MSRRWLLVAFLCLPACGNESTGPLAAPDPLVRSVTGKYWVQIYADEGSRYEYWLTSGSARCFVSPQRYEQTEIGTAIRCIWETLP